MIVISRFDALGLNEEKRWKCGEGGGLVEAAVASCGVVAWGNLVGWEAEWEVVRLGLSVDALAFLG